jgi:hypothetical protein
VTIKAELLDEVLKDYRGPQGTDAWDKEKADPNGKPQKAPSLPQTFTRSPRRTAKRLSRVVVRYRAALLVKLSVIYNPPALPGIHAGERHTVSP